LPRVLRLPWIPRRTGKAVLSAGRSCDSSADF
jgi:hypothetical protein